jgi:hypothetical protein
MLPDYPLLKKKLNKRFRDAIKQDIKKDPFLSRIGEHKIHEGSTMTTTSIDGFSRTTDYPEIAAKYEISFQETIDTGPEAVFLRSKNVSKEMIDKLTAQFVALMEEVTKKTGNIVDAKKVDSSSNPILDVLEKIEVNFDKFGNPIMPTIVVHPGERTKIMKRLEELEKNPDMEKRLREVIEKKKKQLLDRENSRKLVD